MNSSSTPHPLIDEPEWFEVWVDDTARPPYVLMLFPAERESRFDIFDPKENRVVHTENSYTEAMFWLTEDEYTRVNGRMCLD